jgi:hypothetical protein
MAVDPHTEKLLFKHLPAEQAQRARRLLEAPTEQWSDSEKLFMQNVLRYCRRRENATECGCWVMVIVVGVILYLVIRYH